MSNWSDIRIRITADNGRSLMEMNEKARGVISATTKRDRNAMVFFGSTYFKLVWPTAKVAEGTLYMMGHCRTGIQIQDAADILRWFGKTVSTFEMNVRDDENRTFIVFRWNQDDRNVLFSRWIPVEAFPELGDPESKTYDHETMAALYKALKENGQTLVLPLDELSKRTTP